ncbi:MAG: AhpC/TSA family protein [Cytophagales bacterium]|nr:AhpC/TSA family protein [Cytophagales bacterium]
MSKFIKISSLAFLFIACLVVGQEIAKNPMEIAPLKKNKKAPTTGELLSIQGEKVQFGELIKDKKTLVIFYRGGWCPFCNRHLANLRDIVEPLKAKGVQIIAISPDSQKRLENTYIKHNLSYEIYGDVNFDVMKGFGVAFKQGQMTLPVPSVFYINEKGKIKFAHHNSDYTKRLSNKKILKAIK